MQLDETIKEKIISILNKYNIKKAFLFGSYARGEMRKESDLDLILEFPEGFSLLDHVALENELSTLLNIKVDILSVKGISPYLKDEIMKDVVVIYE